MCWLERMKYANLESNERHCPRAWTQHAENSSFKLVPIRIIARPSFHHMSTTTYTTYRSVGVDRTPEQVAENVPRLVQETRRSS